MNKLTYRIGQAINKLLNDKFVINEKSKKSGGLDTIIHRIKTKSTTTRVTQR